VRPIRIEMIAFGSYKSEVVDFRKLGTHKIFLLDAIFFALFDSTSGKERPISNVRSDFAPANLTTEVTFDFALGTSIYRCHRIPSQERQRKRGTGTTTKPAKAYLWDRTQATTDEAPGRLIAENIKPVKEAIEELLGCDAEQFRKTAILPQGRFREVVSDAAKRVEILANLFETKIYKEIEDELKHRKSEVKNEADQTQNQIRETLGDEYKTQAELAEAAATQGKALDEANATQATLEQKKTKAETALSDGRTIKNNFENRQKAQERVKVLEQKAKHIAKQRSELERAKHAQSLADVERHVSQRKQENTTALGQRNAEQLALTETRNSYKTVKSNLQVAQQNSPHIERLSKELDQLERQLEQAQKLEQSRQDLNQAATTFKERQAELASSKAEQLIVDNELTKLNQRLDEAGTIAKSADAEKMRLDRAKETRDRIIELGITEKSLSSKRLEITDSDRTLEAMRAQLRRLELQQQCLFDAQFENMAAQLASHLALGAPCAVCGSHEHPKPAQANAAIPNKENIEHNKSDIESAKTKLDTQQSQYNELKVDETRLHTTADQYRKNLGDNAQVSEANVQAQVQACEESLNAAKAAQAHISTLESNLIELKAKREQLASKLKGRDNAVAEADKSVALCTAEVKRLEGELPKQLQSVVAFEDQRTKKQARKANLESNLQRAKDDEEQLRDERQAQLATFETQQKRCGETAEHLQVVEQELIDRTVSAGFANSAEFEQAKRAPEQTAALAGEISNYDDNLSRASEQLSMMQKACEGHALPKLDELERIKIEASQAYQKHYDELVEITVKTNELNNQITKISELKKAAGKHYRQYENIAALTDVATGTNPHKLSFERFVLAVMLDRVLEHSNQHMGKMTGGKLSLKRTGKPGTGRDKALDLEVCDAITGTTRPASTLSGGEGFQAALAMALGLADQFKAGTGGVRLDSIFVDEGFGSLGPDDLNAVLKVLHSLQTGDRLVGVISHVEQLKAAIPARLEVEKGLEGSTTRFVLP
jgi:exonuclease SbcC